LEKKQKGVIDPAIKLAAKISEQKGKKKVQKKASELVQEEEEALGDDESLNHFKGLHEISPKPSKKKRDQK